MLWMIFVIINNTNCVEIFVKENKIKNSCWQRNLVSIMFLKFDIYLSHGKDQKDDDSKVRRVSRQNVLQCPYEKIVKWLLVFSLYFNNLIYYI